MSFTTRYSILEGVKDQNGDSWERFYNLYEPLIRLHGRDCGLKNENLDDLVQNVMISMSMQMPNFTYEPDKGRFRDYLRKIIRARAADMLRKIYRQERIPRLDGDESYLDDLFNAEWVEHVRKYSLQKLKDSASPKHYQIFHLLDVQNRKVKEIARMYKMSEATIYSIRSRMEEKLKSIAEALDI